MGNRLRSKPGIWLVIGVLAYLGWGCNATVGDDLASPGSQADSLDFLDTDQDGDVDAVDLDGDGQPDFSLGNGLGAVSLAVSPSR